MTSLNDSMGMLLNSSPTSYNTKSAYEAGLVVDAPVMNKTDINGFAQDRTFNTMFPPVCIKTHWDSEALSKHILPKDLKVPLPVDPRPLVRVCSMYSSPAKDDPEGKQVRSSLELAGQPGGSAGIRSPFELYVKNINVESDIYLNHPQDKCDETKWVASMESDLFTNTHAPPTNVGRTFSELSRPLATIVPSVYKCRAEADDLAWSRSSRLFNNVTREDRMSGGTSRSSEALLSSKSGLVTGKPDDIPRIWPSKSVVFYVASGDGGMNLLRLCQALRARSYEVYIFCDNVKAIYEGISYHNHSEFVPNDRYSILVMWGLSKLLSNYQHRPLTKVLLLSIDEDVDVCDNTIKESVDKIVVKSSFHRTLYKCYQWSKFEIIPNGLPVELFLKNRGVLRDRHRVLVTEYSKPLISFIKDGWLRIVSTYPGAELHVWSREGDAKKEILPYIKNDKSVVLHGTASLEELIIERFKSSVHLYLEDKDSVSNDTLRLSALAGCIPIMPGRGVNTELGGVNVEGAVTDPAVILEYTKAVSAVFNDQVYSSGLRKRLQKDNSLKGWNATCDRWIKIMEGIMVTKLEMSKVLS